MGSVVAVYESGFVRIGGTASECCVTFCCPTKWISYICAYTSPLKDFHRPCPISTSVDHHSSWAPCITEQLPLASYFCQGNAYTSILPPDSSHPPFLKWFKYVVPNNEDSIEKSNIWLQNWSEILFIILYVLWW